MGRKTSKSDELHLSWKGFGGEVGNEKYGTKILCEEKGNEKFGELRTRQTWDYSAY